MLMRDITKLLTLLLLTSCVVTGPADDGYENSNEWVDNGRLVDAETKVIYRSPPTENTSKNSKVETESSISEGSGLDFAAFKVWQEAKQQNSPEYQKFRQWQEYEKYQQWKNQQKSE